MSRGKHARSQQSRRHADLTAQLDHLQAALDIERELLTRAHSAAAHTAQLRAELGDLTREREQAVAGYLQRLTAERDEVFADLRRRREMREEITDAWGKLFERLCTQLGGGSRGLEAACNALGVIQGFVSDGVAGSIDGERARRLQRVRGVRPPAPRNADAKYALQPHDGGRALAGVPRPVLDLAGMYVDDQLDLLDEATAASLFTLTDAQAARLADRRDALLTSTARSLSTDAIALWHPAPLLAWNRTDPFADVPSGLGVLDATDPAGAEARTAHDHLRTGALGPQVARDNAVVVATNRLRYPWQPMPRFARPGDAVALRHLYALAGHGQWLRSAEAPVPSTLDGDDEATWTSEPPTPLTLRLARCAVGLRTAVPFWLPPAQTHAFLDAEAGAHDVDTDLRVPFDAVLLTFAEPLALPGSGAPSSPGLRQHLRRFRARVPDVAEFLGDAPAAMMNPQPTVGQMLREHGGRVEAILLLADGEGHLREEFAWCVAVGGAGPDSVTARVALPASRAALTGTMSDVVTNAASVVGWGDWHAPDTELVIPDGVSAETLASDRRFRQLESRGGAGGVRVLNVRRTTSRSVPSAATGRTLAPHVRRGHWRRQHHGTGRALVKRVWVGPVLVNAGRFVDVAPRVYRLPLQALSGPGSSPLTEPEPA